MRHPLRHVAPLLVMAVLTAACGDDGDPASSTAPSTSEVGTTITSVPESAAGEECLVGMWEADVASYREGYSGYLGRVGGPTLGDVTGRLVIDMDGERFVATFEDWTVTLVLPGGEGETRVTTNGDQRGAYTGTSGTLAVTGISSTLDTAGSVTVGGVETDLSAAPIDLDAFAQSNLFSDPMPYDCESDRLVLTVVVPDLGEEFTTGLART